MTVTQPGEQVTAQHTRSCKRHVDVHGRRYEACITVA